MDDCLHILNKDQIKYIIIEMAPTGNFYSYYSSTPLYIILKQRYALNAEYFLINRRYAESYSVRRTYTSLSRRMSDIF